MTTLYTIGFTKTTARGFFGRLREAGITTLLDVRLNNRSQLAGFSKAVDLEYFLEGLLGARYEHRLDLGPTKSLLDRYKARQIDWHAYHDGFRDLLVQRQIERGDRAPFEGPTVLLCSEPTAEHCHRRVVAEYLAARWGDVDVHHL